MLLAVISEASSRYPNWLYVFGEPRVPVLDREPVRATLRGKTSIPIHRVDLEAVSAEAHPRLVDFLMVEFNETRFVVERSLRAEGLALLADEVTLIEEE